MADGFSLSPMRLEVAQTKSPATATRNSPTQCNSSASPGAASHMSVQSAEPASTPHPSGHQPLMRMTPIVPAAIASRYPNRTGVLGSLLPMIAGLAKPPTKARPATKMP